MPLIDRRVLPHLRPARAWLTAVVGVGLVDGLLGVAQAFAVAALVVEAVSDPGGPGRMSVVGFRLAGCPNRR